MSFRFHPQALEELERAALHYEDRQAGLGERFVAAIEAAIDSVVAAPETWPALATPVRRRLTRVFPYALLYVPLSDHVLIVAVMHCHQKPGYWRPRLEPED
ncbi:MAG: type II toxin-antitoxin system RelE/ParE family toxin [Pseudomonadota bacterium]